MREILCKGKRIDNGEWVEGCLVIDHSRSNLFEYRIQPVESGVLYAPPIDPETLCQFTGLCDKNGKKIWENDIVLVIYENRYYEKKELSTGRIVFIRGAWYIGGKVWNELYAIDEDAIFQVEIVGNIFDNPELLQEESDE